MQNIDEIEKLVKIISKLPGLGPKSAKRIILKLINSRDELMRPMAHSLVEVYKNVSRCKSCGSLKSNMVGCNNCDINENKYNKICVVESIADQWSIESSNIYQGYFHILGGTLSSSTKISSKELCSVTISLYRIPALPRSVIKAVIPLCSACISYV